MEYLQALAVNQFRSGDLMRKRTAIPGPSLSYAPSHLCPIHLPLSYKPRWIYFAPKIHTFSILYVLSWISSLPHPKGSEQIILEANGQGPAHLITVNLAQVLLPKGTHFPQP